MSHPVDFYLGCSINSIKLGDREDDDDTNEFDNSCRDKYFSIDPDGNNKNNVFSLKKNNNNNNAHQASKPPNDNNNNITPGGAFPPSPPPEKITSPIHVLSAVEDLNDIDHTGKNTGTISSYCDQINPSSSSPDLIEINLDPPSPLTLDESTSSVSSVSTTMSSSLNEEWYCKMANIIPDPWVHDQFHDTRPILADPDRPFIPTSPLFKSVDDLLSAKYPDLLNDPNLYAFHKRRLLTNRQKLIQLKQTMESKFNYSSSCEPATKTRPSRSKIKLN